MVHDLDQRSQDIFRLVVDAYLETGAPVGSRLLSERLGMGLSPASIRNVMASLEATGLLFSPHTSAGRLPTEQGLRLFVDGLLEFGDMGASQEKEIQAFCTARGQDLPSVLEQASAHLSGLSHCAGLVMAPKTASAIKHIEFVYLEPGKALVVLVSDTGNVENRIVEIPAGIAAANLQMASNYLNARLSGKTLEETLTDVESDIKTQKSEIDSLTQKVVKAGLGVWAEPADGEGTLILKGQSNLLKHAQEVADLHALQSLFSALERTETLQKLLEATGVADGVQIYIGSESELFGLTGCSMVISPFKNQKEKIVGAIGVIGPTRINYARIVPMVDYTSKVITKLLS